MARGPLSDGGDCAARRIAAIAIAIGAAFASPLHAQEAPKPAPPPTPPLIPQPAEPAKPAAERMKGELERLRERRERVRADAETALRRRLVPQPMDAARLATLVAAIDPKLASDALLVDGYREYLAAHETIAEDPGRKILQLAPACYVFDAARETFEPRPTPELGTLLALRDTALRRAREAESRLLSLVERLAPGERRGAVLAERVAWAIERSPRTGTLPSTGLTLLELVARLGLDESAQTSVAPLLARYAEDLAKLLAARADTLARADADRARIETEAGALWRYADPELVVEIERDLAAVDARELAAELAIRDLHADSLRLLRMRLDPRMGRRLVEQWQRAVHPELFDDELMLSRLAEQVLALPSLGEEGERSFLEALEASYQKLEALGRAACEAADRVPPRAGEASNAEILDEVEARIAVVEAQRARRAALREAILRLRAAAPNDVPEISRRFDDLLATLSAYERADLFDRASLARRADEIARRSADAIAPQQPGAAPTTPDAAPPAPDQAKPATPAKPRGEDATQGGRGGRGSRRTLDGR